MPVEILIERLLPGFDGVIVAANGTNRHCFLLVGNVVDYGASVVGWEEGGAGKRGIFVTADIVGQRSDQRHRGLRCDFIESLMTCPPLTHRLLIIHQMFVFCVARRHLPALD